MSIALRRLSLALIFGFAPLANAQVDVLSFRPAAEQYSQALDRIIMFSGNPDLLHIYDPAAKSDVTVALPDTPATLSVSPDGLHAAVGMTSAVVYVDVQAASITKTFQVDVSQSSVALSDTQLYVFPTNYGPASILDLASGSPVATLPYFNGAAITINPVNGQAYFPSYGLDRLDTAGGTITQTSWSYNGLSACNSIWFSPDGKRLYTGCGTVVKSSTDPSADMTYIGTIKASSNLQSLTESAALSEVAYIAQQASFQQTNPLADTVVHLLSSPYLTPAGSYGLTPFTTANGSFPSHGQATFFRSDSSRLYVVTQADAKAGLTNDFAIETIPLSNLPACTVSLDPSSITDEGDGGLYTTQITAGTGCAFSATAGQPWITLAPGSYGSGNTALTFELQRNTSGSSRTGSITIGGQTVAITQNTPMEAAGSPVPLSFNPVQSLYDKQLDRFLMVSSTPNELHIFDPVANTDQVVALSLAPLSLSIGPDGTRAAVGHDGWVSYVDLNQVQVLNVFPLQARADLSVLAGNGIIYAFGVGQGFGAASVNIGTGAVTPAPLVYSPQNALLDPSGNYIDADGFGIIQYDIRNGGLPPGFPFSGVANDCSDFWFSQDGTRLFTACATVLHLSDVPSQNLTLAGDFDATGSSAVWVDDSRTAASIAVIPGPSAFALNVQQPSDNDTQVQFYTSNGLALSSQVALPTFPAGGKSYPGHGRVVSWNSSGSTVFALEQADTTSNLVNPYSVATISNPAALPACTYTVDTAPIAVEPNSTSIPVPGTSPNCNWTAFSDVDWMGNSNVQAPGSTSGAANLNSNPDPTPRTGHLILGGQSIPVTQDASTCVFSVTPIGDVQATADAQTQIITVTVPDGCAWTGYSASPWITISGSASGTGNGILSLALAANNQTASRQDSVNLAGQQIWVYQNGATVSPNGLGFVPVTPCRVVDTRQPDGPFGGPLIAGGESRDFALPAGACNIPATAQAYALNVTAVPSHALGYLTLSPTGGTRPLVATLNSVDGRVKSNAAILPAGSNGAIDVFSSNDTQVIIDIDGYFVPVTGNQNALAFFPVTPCRILDTRKADGPLGGPFVSGGSSRDIPLQQSNCNLSAAAQAYSLNFTAVPHGPLGYLTAWAGGQPQPLVSTLNAVTGTVTANAAILPAGQSGDISVFLSNDGDLVLDVTGYFQPFTSSTSGGLSFYTLPPCRVLDTRKSGGSFDGLLSTDAGSACGLPSNAQAAVLNATVVPKGSLGYLTVWPQGQLQPIVSTLNALDGSVTSNLAVVPVSNSTISVFAAGSTDLVLDIFGYFAP